TPPLAIRLHVASPSAAPEIPENASHWPPVDDRIKLPSLFDLTYRGWCSGHRSVEGQVLWETQDFPASQSVPLVGTVRRLGSHGLCHHQGLMRYFATEPMAERLWQRAVGS